MVLDPGNALPSATIEQPLRVGERIGDRLRSFVSGGNLASQVVDAAVAQILQAIQENQQPINHVQGLYHLHVADPTITGLDRLADSRLISLMNRLAVKAETINDWLADIAGAICTMEILDQQVPNHKGLTNALSELRQLRDQFNWVARTFFSWSDQARAAYETRHPEVKELAIDTVDLGPTNSARLPPVL